MLGKREEIGGEYYGLDFYYEDIGRSGDGLREDADRWAALDEAMYRQWSKDPIPRWAHNALGNSLEFSIGDVRFVRSGQDTWTQIGGMASGSIWSKRSGPDRIL